MRIAYALPLLLLAAAPGFARDAAPGMTPAAKAEPVDAGWAEWEAQSRVVDGDYDGAVQAEQQANTDRLHAAQEAARKR